MTRPRIVLFSAALVLILATLGALAAFGVFETSSNESAVPTERPRTGLDVVLRAEGRSLSADEMQRSVKIMSERLETAGIAEFELRAQGSNEIALWLDHVPNPSRALELVTKTGRLEFFDLETSLAGPSLMNSAPRPLALYPLLKAVANEAKARGTASYYLFDKVHNLVAGPRGSSAELLRSATRAMRPGDIVLGVPGSTEIVSCDKKTSHFCPGGKQALFVPEPGATWYYLFRLPAQLTGSDLNASGIRAELTDTSGPVVSFRFTNHGAEVFSEITKSEWTRGQTLGPQHFAIVLDGRLITTPQIDPMDKQLSNGVDASVSGTIIQGIDSIGEARGIAAVLRTGVLPAHFEVVATYKLAPASSGG